jgi:hypothetical protein
MCLDHFLEDLEAEFKELIWRDDPDKLLAESILRAKSQARETDTAVQRRSAGIHELKQRIGFLEEQQARISEEVGIYLRVSDRANAWRHALELDRVRAELGVARRRVASEERRRELELGQMHRLEEAISSLQASLCPKR